MGQIGCTLSSFSSNPFRSRAYLSALPLWTTRVQSPCTTPVYNPSEQRFTRSEPLVNNLCAALAGERDVHFASDSHCAGLLARSRVPQSAGKHKRRHNAAGGIARSPRANHHGRLRRHSRLRACAALSGIGSTPVRIRGNSSSTVLHHRTAQELWMSGRRARLPWLEFARSDRDEKHHRQDSWQGSAHHPVRHAL